MIPPESIPTIINGMPVVLYSRIDERHRHTGGCVHTIPGAGVLGTAWGLAICKSGEGSYYLLYCGDDWDPLTDTWHATTQDAMAQAEFEYEGIESTWLAPPN